MSITYHKKGKKRLNKHGFRKRMATRAGRSIINSRRNKKRSSLSVSERA